ncbi:hypothetical protein HPB51_011177 [Rhipicephalus microplus]|uniref:Tick transposon n=1 Tax=Rhipicephalus microplus TaxID=6941 RepID=A0A9J6F1P8_RHIMP|nr:hypothetical protein HPB51_011177 [Rhipicephalus microplus]
MIATRKPLTNETLLLRILPVILSGTATCWRRHQCFNSRFHFGQLFGAKYLSPEYVTCMEDELRRRTQAEDESLQEYTGSLLKLYDHADLLASDAKRVTRPVR